MGTEQPEFGVVVSSVREVVDAAGVGGGSAAAAFFQSQEEPAADAIFMVLGKRERVQGSLVALEQVERPA